MSDEEVARLRAGGMSFRAVARELSMSLGGVQRALKRTGYTGAPVAHWEELADPAQWWRLDAMERWRMNHFVPAPVPVHDTDGTHRLCCLVRGHDPDYTPDFGGPWSRGDPEPRLLLRSLDDAVVDDDDW